jgi:Arm DNA-binding domain
MYVLVKPSGTLTFRLDYRMNGRRETVTFGKHGPMGPSRARARELCIDAKRAIDEGRSPRLRSSKRSAGFWKKELWRVRRDMADCGPDGGQHAGNASIDLRARATSVAGLLTEITPDELRAHCGVIVDRGAPATTIRKAPPTPWA